ncbi:hypothetical protein LLG39_06590 [bacterium]|nr:hypothetical protein [bacterium]
MMRRMNRDLLKMHSLSERNNLLDIRQVSISPDDATPQAPERELEQIKRLAERVFAARKSGKAVMLTYGAHLVKNGLGPVVAKLIAEGWVTHVATNGAGSIHDWEFAYLGKSSESVRDHVAKGMFGTWDETGRFINLAIAMGGVDDLGYGWSVGKMIAEDGINVPSKDSLKNRISNILAENASGDELGALADALSVISKFDLPEGHLRVAHPFKDYSIQYAAWKNKVPFTVHPGIGYDIIYTHPANNGGAIGRAAVRDFLSYADSVCNLGGGVHISVGSAIMAPMIFEKSLSMANNKSIIETGQAISNHYLTVVDIQDGGGWDWSQGEPPKDNPAYYLRFCKSFNRMGGTLDYICTDNRQFLMNLYKELNK